MATKKKKNHNVRVGMEIGAAVAATAAAAAGAYWLYGAKHSAKHRKVAKSWMLKARAEIMDMVGEVDEMDRARYMGIVDDVLKRYAGVSGSTRDDVARVARELKSSWTHIAKANTAAKRPIKKAKKAVRKVRKAIKKSR